MNPSGKTNDKFTDDPALDAAVQATLDRLRQESGEGLKNDPGAIIDIPSDYCALPASLRVSDLGFPRLSSRVIQHEDGHASINTQYYTLDHLRAGLSEILYRLRLFPEAGTIPEINTASLTETDVRRYVKEYGFRLLEILGPRHWRQIQREDKAIKDGIQRYQEALEKRVASGQASLGPTGDAIIHRYVLPMADDIKRFIDEVIRGKAGLYRAAVYVLRLIEPEAAAYITVKLAFDAAMQPRRELRKWTALQGRIGDTVLLEIRLNKDAYKNCAYYKKLMKEIQELESKPGNKKIHDALNKKKTALQALRINMSNIAEEERTAQYDTAQSAAAFAEQAGSTVRDAVGACLMQFLLFAAEQEKKQEKRPKAAFTKEQITTGQNQRPAFLTAADWLMDEFNEAHEVINDRHPLIRPMLTFPAVWTLAANATGVEPGGYRGYVAEMTKWEGLAKTNDKEQITALSTVIIGREKSLIGRVVNALQNTAFRINKRVYSVMKELRDTPLTAPIHPKDQVDYTDKNRRAKARLHDNWHRRGAPRLRAFKRTLDEATDNLDEPAIFFPHTFDYRGRVYPKGAFLNPQGNDVARGLLEFAEGKPITTPEAERALAVHGTNCYGRDGVDKLPLIERLQWVRNHEKEIKAIAEADAPEGSSLWKAAKDKWQFLAFCYDWADYLKLGAAHVSHLPVFVDGTCNGYQHMSALTRNRDTGKMVGMAPWGKNETPHDIYETVMDHVKARVEADAAAHDKIAVQIIRIINAKADNEEGFALNRSLAKSPVMTFGYGSNQYGMSDSLEEKLRAAREDYPPKTPDSQWMLLMEKTIVKNKEGKEYNTKYIKLICNYLAKLFFETLNTEITGAATARAMLGEIAKKITGTGKGGAAIYQPIWYTSPSGFPMKTAKYEMKPEEVRVQIFNKRITFQIDRPKATGGGPLLDTKKTADAFPPNIIHSLDSAHLAFTIDRCHAEGVRSFVTTHDCFGCLAADMPKLNTILRQEFVAMYRDLDISSLARSLAVENNFDPVTFSNIACCGDIDLEYILKSDTFFS